MTDTVATAGRNPPRQPGERPIYAEPAPSAPETPEPSNEE